jgi:hypothetical protein
MQGGTKQGNQQARLRRSREGNANSTNIDKISKPVTLPTRPSNYAPTQLRSQFQLFSRPSPACYISRSLRFNTNNHIVAAHITTMADTAPAPTAAPATTGAAAPMAGATAAASNAPADQNVANRGLPYYEKLRRELRDTLQKKRLMDKSMVSAVLRFLVSARWTWFPGSILVLSLRGPITSCRYVLEISLHADLYSLPGCAVNTPL